MGCAPYSYAHEQCDSDAIQWVSVPSIYAYEKCGPDSKQCVSVTYSDPFSSFVSLITILMNSVVQTLYIRFVIPRIMLMNSGSDSPIVSPIDMLYEQCG